MVSIRRQRRLLNQRRFRYGDNVAYSTSGVLLVAGSRRQKRPREPTDHGKDDAEGHAHGAHDDAGESPPHATPHAEDAEHETRDA